MYLAEEWAIVIQDWLVYLLLFVDHAGQWLRYVHETLTAVTRSRESACEAPLSDTRLRATTAHSTPPSLVECPRR